MAPATPRQEHRPTGRERAAGAAVPAALGERVTLRASQGDVRGGFAAYRAAGVTMLPDRPIAPGPVRPAETVEDRL
ncbi:hypothetical protein MUU72_06490 [Streptomyces sp. RS10V-4]|uniref:hypothetical protein n=1 Tax=Streptomyces rhizoryzae TaxID=2932493 RepID=UPI002002BBA6|nr:hypothetical protein [Streptomyces rhizoryzae]MCK7622753.1 hypothetical protein [Streptomyces rhizoryzae]